MSNMKMRILALTIVLTTVLTAFPIYSVSAATDTKTVPGWSCEVSNAEGGVAIDNDVKYSGEASMKLWNNTPKNSSYVRISYPITVEPGHSYRYGFMAKVQNATKPYAQMNWIRTSLGYLTPTGRNADWRAFEFSYNNDDATTTAYLRFVLEDAGDTVWVDDLYFYDTSKPQTPENNMIKNPSFEGIASAQASSASQDIIPVGYKNVAIDGSASEWADVPAHELELYTDYAKAGQSITANIKYAYDDKNFYFVLSAKDDVHFPVTAGSYWNGDGLQFTLCGTDETFGTAYGLVYDEANNMVVEFGDTVIETSASRKGNETLYEVAIPWSARFKEMPTVVLFCAIANDNDNDGKGRRGCIDVAPGISAYKGSQLFPKMMMLKEGEEFAAFFQGTADVDTGGEATYTVDLINQKATEKKFTIRSEAAGVDDSIVLGGGASGSYKFTKTHKGYGDAEVDVTVSDGIATFKDTAVTNVCANEEMTVEVIEKHKKYYDEVTELMAKCEAKSIPIEYQKVKYNTIRIFIGYMEEDLTDKDFERIAEQDKVLTRLYNELKVEFGGLLDGSIEPVSVPKYVTSPIEVVDDHFVATTRREDGTEERRPVFFVGGGHWPKTQETQEIKNIASVGFNCTSPELGPWDMTEAIAPNWAIDGIGTYEIGHEITSAEKRSGEKSIKLTADKEWVNNNYDYLRQTVEVKPNTTYEYGLSVKSKTAKRAWYSIKEIGNKQMRMSLDGTYDWRDDVHTYTTGPNETKLSFILLLEDITEIYLDDVFIREQGSDVNLMQNGGFEKEYPEGIYYDHEEATVKNFVRVFADCDANNLSAQFSASPHYIPDFLKVDYPEIVLPEQWGNFNHQDPDHPEVLRMYEIFYKSLAARLKDNESFDGIILCNEPQYNSQLDQWAFIDDFRNAMKEKYQTIAALNKRWGTSYASFDEVEMPVGIEASPRYYDWRMFNDQILPAWVEKIEGYIKEVAPDVLSHVKVMDTFKTGVNFRVSSSDNYEILSDITDISGCDAWSMIATDDVRWKNIFYDFLTSVKTAPIYNTEDHIIVDARQLTYNDKETLYNIVDIWNGAVHGRGGSVLWLWDRYDRSKNGTIYFNSVITARPDTIATLGKTTLDLNRLSKEVVALQEAKGDMAILYTPNAVPYSDEMLDIIRKTSAALGENGQKTRFVVESQLEKFDEYKTIIIPNTISLYKETLDKLKSFVDNGGKLLVIGENALTKNEYGDKHDESVVAHIKSKAVCIGFEDAGTTISAASGAVIKDEITKFVKADGLDKVTFIDKATGKPLCDADWITAEYDGSYIVNLCSYTWDSREVEMYIDGEKVTSSEDLINFGKYGESIKLDGHVPLLLKVAK